MILNATGAKNQSTNVDVGGNGGKLWELLVSS